MEPLSAHGAAATGDLRSAPLAHLLIELLEAQASGTVFVHGPQDELVAMVRIETGVPVRVAAAAVESSLLQSLVPLCALADGRFEFGPDEDASAPGLETVSGRVDPLALVAACARGPMREDAVADVMVVIERNLLKLNPRVDLERYALLPQERELCERLAADFVDLPQLYAQTELPEPAVRRLLYVLRVTHALTLLPHVRRQHSGPVEHAHPPSLPPAPELDWQDALEPDAPGGPGRYVVHEPEQQDETVTSEAPRKRVRGQSGPLQPQAEAHYQRAQMLLKQKDYSEGLREAREAVKLGATQAEHQALYAWLLYQHGGGNDRIHPRVWEHLEHALKRDPRCERAHHYKASLLKRVGKLDHAHVHFKRALKLDRNNLEAAREVRLYEMRKRHGQESAGLVDRLFRRRK